MSNKLDRDYKRLLQTIIDFGVEKTDRTGTGTKSIFGYTIRHDMSEGFPLLTTKKMAWKTMVTELLWFLKGDTNIKWLLEQDNTIWVGDAYKRFLNETIKLEPAEVKEKAITQLLNSKESKEEFINKIKTDDEFAKKWGELGPIYGKQWRSWGGKNVTNYDLKDVKGSDQPKVLEAIKNGEDVTKYGVKIEYQNNSIDQIQNLINDLKINPDSRRLMVSAWNVGELDQMVLPPCHYGFQVYTRPTTREEKIVNPGKYRAISLMWNQRSVDTFLGLPFNIASYGLLLEIIAKEVNMVPDQLIGNLGDVHLYLNHIEQAKEQIGREYTPEEKQEMLKEAMGVEAYNKAVEELMPFGGGLYEYYIQHKIPRHTREPFELPILKIEDEVKWKEGDCLPSYSITDFTLENYQSHPAIKAPLSN